MEDVSFSFWDPGIPKPHGIAEHFVFHLDACLFQGGELAVTHRIHGNDIFTYMKTIKIKQM